MNLLREPAYIRYEDVLDLLAGYPFGLTCKEVAAMLGVGYDTALFRLHAAWNDDKVERSDEGTPYRWRL